jgi:hypothetical protein
MSGKRPGHCRKGSDKEPPLYVPGKSGKALADFITFSTYGTWLHGTSKGKGSVDHEHNTYAATSCSPMSTGNSDRAMR